jgi:shikimate kinase
MVVLMIGPKSVGKTTLGRYAAELRPDKFVFFDLEEQFQNGKGCSSIDYINQNGAQACLDAFQDIIEHIAYKNIKKNCLIEIANSAFSDASVAFNWFLHTNYSLLTVFASANSILERDPANNTSLPEAINFSEYSSERKAIYNLARPNYLDLSKLTKLEAKEKFINFIDNELLLVTLS